MLSAIMKTSMHGENPTVVISSGLDTPYGLAVDSVGRKVGGLAILFPVLERRSLQLVGLSPFLSVMERI